MFIGNDDDAVEPIDSMPGVFRYGANRALEYLEPLVYSFGLRSVLLFPVATKADKMKLSAETKNNADDSDEDDDAASNSSDSPNSERSYASSSSSGGTREVMPERLLNDGEVNDEVSKPAVGSQNPFLNQNEEEHHLLACEQGGGIEGTPNRPSPVPVPPPRANEHNARAGGNVSRKEDVRLIKGMALKDKYNPVLRLIPKLRVKFPKLLIICDVCLCAFTSTGHCCLFEDHVKATNASGQALKHGSLSYFPISNNTSCHYLAMLSVEYAVRGCDVVAPSDMMDGRILTIRQKLNENGFNRVAILSYSAKFASAFYGPFRQATNNAPEFGDRRAYQLPPGSRALAIKAVKRDIEQGADFVMVKPAGPYLDIVRDISERHPEIPIAVYQVSGEYSMLKVAAGAGVLDLNLALREMLTAFRRSGATIIISYFTPELLKGEFSVASD